VNRVFCLQQRPRCVGQWNSIHSRKSFRWMSDGSSLTACVYSMHLISFLRRKCNTSPQPHVQQTFLYRSATRLAWWLSLTVDVRQWAPFATTEWIYFIYRLQFWDFRRVSIVFLYERTKRWTQQQSCVTIDVQTHEQSSRIKGPTTKPTFCDVVAHVYLMKKRNIQRLLQKFRSYCCEARTSLEYQNMQLSDVKFFSIFFTGACKRSLQP
jgi:hypothetical protein